MRQRTARGRSAPGVAPSSSRAAPSRRLDSGARAGGGVASSAGGFALDAASGRGGHLRRGSPGTGQKLQGRGLGRRGRGPAGQSAPLRWWRLLCPVRERLLGSLTPTPEREAGEAGCRRLGGSRAASGEAPPPSVQREKGPPRPSLSSWTAPRGTSPTADPASRADLSAGLPRRCGTGAACGRSLWPLPGPLRPGAPEAPRAPELGGGPLLTRVSTQTPWPSP